MDNKYKKILPEDVFISIFDSEPSEAGQPAEVSENFTGNRPTGNNFIDLFACLLRKHGHNKPEYYARIMGVTPLEMCMSIQAMSGIKANEWIWRYLHLASRELLQKTKLSVTEVG